MGLAGRKHKQRIPADPRNLSWADDASRFGLSYLSKFGWDASQGLGSSGDGTKTHLKVQQKLDMMGVGAQHQRDPNGIAWKQNKDFEALLKRLNEQGKGTDGEDTERGDGGACGTAMDKTFVRAQGQQARESVIESPPTPNKRKRKPGNDTDTNEKKKGKQKKEKCRKSNSDSTPPLDSISEPPSTPSSLEAPSGSMPKPRPMAHRARIRAAKRIADKSASAISEILGIAPSSSVSTSTSTPAPTPLSSSSPARESTISLGNLTTSTKNIADYFKEKLGRSSTSVSTSSGSTTPGLGTTRLGQGLSNFSPPDDEDAPPRRGIGSRSLAIPSLTQVSEPESRGDDDKTDGLDTLTERQHRKATRKAEKRKQREAGVGQVSPVGPVKEQTQDDGAVSKKKRKRGLTGSALPEPEKKSKKKRS